MNCWNILGKVMRIIKKSGWIIPYIFSYTVWCAFYKVCPLFYDMYVMKTDYLVRGANFIGVLKAIFFTGGCWRNARYLVNFVSIYFASYEWISDFIMPLVFIVGIYFTQKLIAEEKRWHASIAGFALFWCVSHGITGQCYSYFYVLFLFPVFLLPLFVYLVNGYIEGTIFIKAWYQKALFLFLVYSNACFGEHISCAFSVLMICYLIKSRLKNKRFDKLLVVGTVTSLLQTVYMNMYLIVLKTRPLAEDAASLLDIIKYNFRVLILETWLSNPIVIISFLLILACSIKGHKTWVIADSTIAILYSVWAFAIYKSGGIDTASYKIQPNLVVSLVPFDLWGIWCVLYIGVNLFILYQLFFISEKVAALFFAGGCSTVPILVTPNTGWRISAFYIFMIILSTVALMSRRELNKSFYAFQIALSIIIGLIGTYTFISRIERLYYGRQRVEAVLEETKELQREGKWNLKKDIMCLPHYDARDVIAAGEFGENTYYMWNFCYANGIEKTTIIIDLE